MTGGARFFPGSLQPIVAAPGLRDPLDGLTGRLYKIKGNDVELFTITELSQALNRQPVTIRKWETKGILPKATFTKPGAGGDPRGRRRLYSRAQVEALVQIATEEKVLHDLHRQVTRTQFKTKALAAFKRIATEAQ